MARVLLLGWGFLPGFRAVSDRCGWGVLVWGSGGVWGARRALIGSGFWWESGVVGCAGGEPIRVNATGISSYGNCLD